MRKNTVLLPAAFLAVLTLFAFACSSGGGEKKDDSENGDRDAEVTSDDDSAADQNETTDLDLPPSKTVKVIDIQNPSSSNHPAKDTAVTVNGVIAMGDRFSYTTDWDAVYVSDPDGGAYRGILVAFPKSMQLTNLAVGSELDVVGTYKEYYETSQINADVISIKGTKTPPAATEIINACDIATGGPNAASYEGTLVYLNNVAVTKLIDNTTKKFQVSGCLNVDAKIYSYAQPSLGANFSLLQGFMYFRNKDFWLLPRGADDFKVVVMPEIDGDEYEDEETDDDSEAVEYDAEREYDEEIDWEAPAGLSIWDVQNIQSEKHPSPDALLILQNLVVSSPVFEIDSTTSGLFVSDSVNAEYHGILVRASKSTAQGLKPKDIVKIKAYYYEVGSESQLEAETITVTGTASSSLTPVVVDDFCANLGNGGDASKAEPFEGVLVEIRGAGVTDAGDSAKGTFKVGDCLAISAYAYKFTLPQTVGTYYEKIIGYGGYKNGESVLIPVSADAFTVGTAPDGDETEEETEASE